MSNIDKPTLPDWRSRKEWSTATITSSAKAQMIVMWVFSALFTLPVMPAVFAIEKEIKQGNWAILLVLIFPVVSCFLIYKAVVMTMEYKRFGNVALALDPYPGSIGGHVGGSVYVKGLSLAELEHSGTKLNVRLESVYSYVSGSGKNRSRSENITII